MTSPARAKPFVNQMRRGPLPTSSCRHQQVDGLHRQSGRNAAPQREFPPIKHHVVDPEPPGSWTEIRLGARAHKITPTTLPAGVAGGRRTSQTPFPPPQAREWSFRPKELTHETSHGGLDKARLHR
jgi:hypothetical protein